MKKIITISLLLLLPTITLANSSQYYNLPTYNVSLYLADYQIKAELDKIENELRNQDSCEGITEKGYGAKLLDEAHNQFVKDYSNTDNIFTEKFKEVIKEIENSNLPTLAQFNLELSNFEAELRQQYQGSGSSSNYVNTKVSQEVSKKRNEYEAKVAKLSNYVDVYDEVMDKIEQKSNELEKTMLAETKKKFNNELKGKCETLVFNRKKLEEQNAKYAEQIEQDEQKEEQAKVQSELDKTIKQTQLNSQVADVIIKLEQITKNYAPAQKEQVIKVLATALPNLAKNPKYEKQAELFLALAERLKNYYNTTNS